MPVSDLDATDRRILKQLQNEGKLTNIELSNRIGLSPSPCLSRVRALEQSGVISGYVALVNPEAIGLGVNVFIQITLERQIEQALETFENRMEAYPEVMECFLMTGDSDYLIRLVVRDIAELQRFILQKLSNIPGVANIRSSFALKQVKYRTALPVDDL
ncbi:ArsR family transcriptional regulator [Salipiger aestuarii]|uniref:DNA-binding transcriptional regulator, Lrp family n=2 Tax=Salipiger TaxID=263377 RepID=A0A1G7JIP7_9RHOB|nr:MULTISPECIES: Lrp/AsnC family transcriptional regulator [Rhodobacterales]EIE49962.1 transcription regulator AsnC [Citreicella sp. 357]KAA8605764.1 ArsR family transcriptional regulator [Salipiger aestuarii]KAA8612232.1 ArsR family transcriptional regulator [Salipiger aestuarii]KAB2539922.1 ArsR family transcriptional regulator [Salipiger aestuarii]KMK64072.1 transcriptional regulator [Puniceibacterium sp. IMCC21224]